MTTQVHSVSMASPTITLTRRIDVEVVPAQWVAPNAMGLIRVLIAIAALGRRIALIVRPSAEEQMIEPNTRRIVTGMQDTEAIRDGAIGKLPHPAMGEHTASREPKVTVTSAIPCAQPQPTGVGLPHLGPESGFSIHDSIVPHPAPITASELAPALVGVASHNLAGSDGGRKALH